MPSELFFDALYFSLGLASYFLSPLFSLLLFFGKNSHVLLLFLGLIYGVFSHPKLLEEDAFKTRGKIEVISIQNKNKKYSYRGFFTSSPYKNLPCSFSLNQKLDYAIYEVYAEAAPKSPFFAGIKILSLQKAEKNSFLLPLRDALKTKAKNFLFKNFDERSATFLTALFVGEVLDNKLRFVFRRIGLEHILAISGLHFGILLSLLTFAFRRVFFLNVLLLTIASLYFIFLGPTASVMRAFLMVLLFLFSFILNRRYSAIDALGFSLFSELLYHPLYLIQIGFQLSFIATLGIIIGYTKTDEKLQALLPSSKKVFTFSRKALSVTLSATLFVLPFCLYHFHRFSLTSVFYNLFFPLIVHGLMGLFLFSLPLFFIPYLFKIESFIINLALDLIYYPPLPFIFFLRIKLPGFLTCLCFFTLLFLLTERISFSKLRLFHGDRSSVG